jgi:HEAT repeat protein
MADSRSPSTPWDARLKVAVPVALALLLFGISIALLLFTGAPEEAPPTVVQKPAPKVETTAIPFADPSAKVPYAVQEKPEKFGGRYPRWNLKEFPDGWDHALGETIHHYFKLMEYTPQEKAKLRRLEALREEFREFLRELGPESIATLSAILDVEADFVDRRFLLYALGDLGPQSNEATFALRDFFVKRYENPQSRSELYHSIEAMSRLENDTSFDMLVGFVEGDEHPDAYSYRHKFVKALGEHPFREDATGTFVEAMETDDHPNVRNYAAQALGKIRNPDTLGALYKSFEGEQRWVIQQTILGTIGKIGHATAIPFLEGHARNSSEPAVRLSAAGALRRMDDAYARQVLRELARSEPDPKVRQNIQRWAYPETAAASK